MVWAVSLSTVKLIPHSLTPKKLEFGIRSLIGFGNACASLDQSVALPPFQHFLRLALKLFRGEPAISEFDWLFTPIHRSSDNF